MLLALALLLLEPIGLDCAIRLCSMFTTERVVQRNGNPERYRYSSTDIRYLSCSVLVLECTSARVLEYVHTYKQTRVLENTHELVQALGRSLT